MRIKTIGRVILLPLVTPILTAAPVDISTASRVASSQVAVMNERFADPLISSSPFNLSLRQPELLRGGDAETLLAYVFELEPEGFVVVTGDDDLVPIIAYSEHGSFPWEEHPENHLLNMLREDLNLRLQAVGLMEIEVIEGYHYQWEDMISGDLTSLDPGESWPPAGSTWTGGWVQSAWHQNSPYNNSCPIDPETGYRCIVGCVATAMAQIVNYWQYPNSVIFTEKDSYATDSLDIEIYAPDANIPSIDYASGYPPDSICSALSYACGVGAKMDYSSGESRASFGKAKNTLLSHFNYTNAEYILSKEDSFYLFLEDNMKDSTPAILSIKTSDTASTSHAIICDGIRKTTTEAEWHVNFGWGENSPEYLPFAWYILPQGLPDDYSVVNYALLNVYPPITYTTDDSTAVDQISILDCFPNPFIDFVEIKYILPQGEQLKICIFDVSGRCVRNWSYKHDLPGIYGIRWNGKDSHDRPLPAGIYIITLKASELTSTWKILRLR